MPNFLKVLLTLFALLIPIFACLQLGNRIKKQGHAEWQTTACFAAMAIASSLLLLLVAGEIEFLRYGETQVNRKLREIEKLTEQNKLMAKRTVELVTRATSDSIMGVGHDNAATHQSAIELLKAAGLPDSEIQKFFKDLNQTGARTNSP